MAVSVIKVTNAQERKIVAKEGDDFSLVMSVKNADGSDFDFTDYSAKMQVKKRKVESYPNIFEFSIGNGIVLTEGQINLTKTAEEMSNKSGLYFYDLKIISPEGIVTTWLFGEFELQATVTV